MSLRHVQSPSQHNTTAYAESRYSERVVVRIRKCSSHYQINATLPKRPTMLQASREATPQRQVVDLILMNRSASVQHPEQVQYNWMQVLVDIFVIDGYYRVLGAGELNKREIFLEGRFSYRQSSRGHTRAAVLSLGCTVGHLPLPRSLLHSLRRQTAGTF